MDLQPEMAHLGYKWNVERRRDPPHRLLTSEDFTEAFRKTIEMSGLKKGKKKIIMEIIDLVSDS
jgi:hypothetical protein